MIEKLEKAKEYIDGLIKVSEDFHEDIWKDHKEALITLKEALEKQIPKKPIKINEYLTDRGQWEIDWECATCGNPYIDDSYCSCCGQALDWSKDDD